ncbi:GNAT family N-acetyltransferase [Microbacterium thalassium]|uniref:Putative GNAT family acetyltransferase n=1 Tax=Microbacterium thalassium TaxID=362649 RepID=A0A7X0FN62_9MICO|nr:GNAT family N-acetyltransferase [Microbacterium thalassium]MBB6390071.1 putative GNAT family acetyltransferase [Microbacterium thalassium]GLK25179.1 hypothetical protein GCM10017607_24980 [Microbacterium thalassium]
MTDIDETRTVVRNDEARRYEIFVGDVMGGYTEFLPGPKGRLIFPHTEIDHAYRGRGLSGDLFEGAMADAAARGDTVEPTCPALRRWLRKNKVPGLEVMWPLWARDDVDGGGAPASP